MISNQNKVIELDRWIREKTVHSKILPQIKYGSEEMMVCLTQALNVAKTDDPVIIEGESGVGKEFLAHLIHEHSNRGKQEIVVVNCITIEQSRASADLFGHSKGAFTGADKTKQGFFEMANGSTIFLDEIGDLPLDAQGYLLRILQEGTYYRLGETKERQVDVRVIAATRQNLMDMVKKKLFREDLYYRLEGFLINIPPLRTRKNDIAVLANHFKDQAISEGSPRIIRFTSDAIESMMDYPWPGNVRELRQVVRRSLLNCTESEIHPKHLELDTRPSQQTGQYAPVSLNDYKMFALATALHYCKGNQKNAAKILRVTARVINFQIKKLKIDVDNPLESIRGLQLAGISTDGYMLRMLELSSSDLKKKEQANSQLVSTREELAEAKSKIAGLEARNEAAAVDNGAPVPSDVLNAGWLDVEKEIMKLEGANEYVANYPGIVPSRTTLQEASDFARIAQLVVHLNKAGGNVNKAAELMGIKCAAIYNRMTQLKQKGIDLNKLRDSPDYANSRIPIGMTSNEANTDARKKLAALVYRFTLGSQEKTAQLLGIEVNSFNQLLGRYGLGSEIITDRDRELFQDRRKPSVPNDDLAAENKLLRGKIKGLKTEIDLLKRTMAKDEAEKIIVELRKKLLELTGDYRSLMQKFVDLKKSTDEKLAEAEASFRRQLELKEQDLSILRDQNNSILEQAKINLEKTKVAHQNELIRLKTEFAQKIEEADKKLKTVNKLQQSIDQLQELISALDAAKSEAENEALNQMERADGLEQQLKNESLECAQLQNELANLKTENGKNIKSQQKKISEMESSLGNVAKLQKAINEKHGEILKLRDKINKLNKELADLKKKDKKKFKLFN